MLLVLITYKKPLGEIDYYLLPHRSFLDEGYNKVLIILFGRIHQIQKLHLFLAIEKSKIC
jgi:hypothetical protein